MPFNAILVVAPPVSYKRCCESMESHMCESSGWSTTCTPKNKNAASGPPKASFGAGYH